ncbi:MAG: hypothetical protein KBE65_16305 [Phycisphaerae bacterium]|nr:hypothetical protein [Phycisphaerae bacterium]
MRNGWIAGGAAMVLVLGLAGAGLCAQPIAEAARLLPEATVLSGVDGQLVHRDAGDTWWFEFTDEVKNDRYRIRAGTSLRLLPSSTLERLIADANDRYAPRYRLSAQVTRYEDANYLLTTYFLPLSTFKSDGEAGPTTDVRPAVGDVPADPNLAIPQEIIEKLKNARPIQGPLRKPGEPDRPSSSAAGDYLGRMLVDRVGVIAAADVGSPWDTGAGASALPRLYFTPYALGWNVGDVRYELLPSSALEQARLLQRSSLEPIRFNVAGLVTKFRGTQYLLLQRAAPVYNYGNFGR